MAKVQAVGFEKERPSKDYSASEKKGIVDGVFDRPPSQGRNKNASDPNIDAGDIPVKDSRKLHSVEISTANNGFSVRTRHHKKGANNDYETEQTDDVFNTPDDVVKHVAKHVRSHQRHMKGSTPPASGIGANAGGMIGDDDNC